VSSLNIFLTVAAAAIFALCVLDVAVHWAAGWRYLLSASFRQSTHQRWSTTSRSYVLVQVSFAFLCFLALNFFLAALIWAVFVGPIPSAHP
jgi:hypothetical protein